MIKEQSLLLTLTKYRDEVGMREGTDSDKQEALNKAIFSEISDLNLRIKDLENHIILL